METGDTVLVGIQAGLKGDNWSLRFFGRNLTNEDSVIMGTRWFDLLQGDAPAQYYERFSVKTPGLAVGFSDWPRAVLRSLRGRGRQLGIKLTHHF
ncbi:MAG: hypothetical protein OXT03_02725 [Alphaproteobacteria bacterium]|nr:hypothetical protein [Alphaproteobacteria bacterium]